VQQTAVREREPTVSTAQSARPVWLVLADPLPSRIFLECGIARGLRDRFGTLLTPVFLVYMRKEFDGWMEELGPATVLHPEDVVPEDVHGTERFFRRADGWLDRRVGHFPLAIRFNYRHGFHLDRMRPGHPYPLLDSSLVGPLPRWRSVEWAMRRWVWSRRRHVPHALLQRLKAERPAIVLSTIQLARTAPFVVGARRLGLPLVGYVESWDQTVGKSAIPPFFDRYIVQNEAMRADLVRYHGIEPGRVVVTGWPQSDLFMRPRPRSAYVAVLRELGLDPDQPVVVVMGNTPANAPYEGAFVERLVEWRGSTPDAPQLLFRPHPADRHEWPHRFRAAMDADGCAVQAPSYTDMEVLATLLQHVDCVVSNAGTILLDALVNDRPAVCVLYDEGGSFEESFAARNVSGEHYRELMASAAFQRATSFEEVVAGIRRSLAAPQELAAERRKVVDKVVGDVDGHAADRVVAAIAEAVA